LYAAGFTEYANERHLIYNERRGLFTEALLEGLRGAAATRDPVSDQGTVTTDRLIPYIHDRLNDLTRRENVRQHLWLDTLGVPRPLVLATGIDPWQQQVSVNVPPGTTQVVVQDDRLQTQAVLEMAVGQSSVVLNLELTSYTVTVEPAGTSQTVRLLPGEPFTLDLRGVRDGATVG
jgi:hypothetical protein